MRKWILALSLVVSGMAQASTFNDVLVKNIMVPAATELAAATAGFDWKVGDSASYSMNMGFINGTMTMGVKAVSADALVLTQDADLGFLGKQNCEVTMNPNTGEVLKMICNGKEQQAPEGNDMEVVSMEEANLKVKAGTFNCLHITLKNKKDGAITEQWANPKLVPVMGMIKLKTPSQLGEMVIELTSFKKM